MLVHIGVADALGLGYEFCQDFDSFRFTNGYRGHPKHSHTTLPPGSYSDDTQMSIAISRLMLKISNGLDVSMESFAQAFCEQYHGDRRDGYAKGFQSLLDQCKTGFELLTIIKPQSTRSGAAMRSIPLGLFGDIQTCVSMAMVQAKVTHDTAAGRASSVAVALASFYLYHRLGRLADLPSFLHRVVPLADRSFSNPMYGEWCMKVKKPQCDAFECTRAAIWALTSNRTYSDVVEDSIRLGGDTDTVASIAGGLASLSEEVLDDLYLYPSIVSKLEEGRDGDFGLVYLEKMDREIFSKFPRRQNHQ